jgi:hypothetical protein
MSDMETDMSRVMTPLINGARTTITASEALRIVQWSFKTAVMYEWREARMNNNPRYFKPSDRLAFYRLRQLPDHFWVFVGHYVGPDALWTADIPNTMNIIFEGHPHNFPAYSLTFAIRQLALHVFSFRYPKESGASRISFKLPGVYRRALIPLHGRLTDSTWPPELHFDDEGIKELSHTWRNMRH